MLNSQVEEDKLVKENQKSEQIKAGDCSVIESKGVMYLRKEGMSVGIKCH